MRSLAIIFYSVRISSSSSREYYGFIFVSILTRTLPFLLSLGGPASYTLPTHVPVRPSVSPFISSPSDVWRMMLYVVAQRCSVGSGGSMGYTEVAGQPPTITIIIIITLVRCLFYLSFSDIGLGEDEKSIFRRFISVMVIQ